MMQSLLEALLSDLWGALFIATAILVLLVVSELLYRILGLPTEYTRKFSHIGSGFIVLSFPWLLESGWTVTLLALLFLGILVGGRKTGLLKSIHSVKRRTGGAFYYPVAVLGIWFLSRGEPLQFTVPIAIMAIADTGAALVGSSRGEIRYEVLDGYRTFEGTVTFFGLAFVIVLVALAIAARPGWPDMLLVALVVALLTSAVEGVSVRGSDNLLIPYAAWLVLQGTAQAGGSGISGWIVGMLLALGVVLTTMKLVGMTPSGALLTFVIGTLTYALGGLQWLFPLLTLYVAYIFFVSFASRGRETDIDRVFPSTAGSLLLVLLLAHFEDQDLFLPYLVTLSANAAMAMAMAVRGPWLVPAVLGGAVLPAVAAFWAGFPMSFLVVLLGGLGGLGFFLLLARTRLVGRRLVASSAAALLVWFVAIRV